MYSTRAQRPPQLLPASLDELEYRKISRDLVEVYRAGLLLGRIEHKHTWIIRLDDTLAIRAATLTQAKHQVEAFLSGRQDV